MNEQEKAHAKDADQIEKRLFNMTVGFALAAIIFAPIFYILTFKELEWGGPRDWGTFATYFSGIVTPVVGFSSALLFFQSIRVQRKELEKTREEMKKATKLQQQVEKGRQALFRQEQLEQSIPKARKKQKNIFEEFRTKLDQRQKIHSGQEQYGIMVELSIEETRKRDENPSVIKKKLFPYFFDTSHLAIMLSRYINVGGDVYYFIELIDDIEAEFDLVREVATEYEITCKQEYKGYAQNVHTLKSEKNKALQYYEHKLYQ